MSSTHAAQRVGVDRVIVVLARDLHPPAGVVTDGVIGAVVTEPQLVGAAAERETEDLVTEADAEHRHLAHERLHDLGSARHRGGIAGAVREEHAVGSAGEDVGRGRARRDHLDVTAGADEMAQDRALDPVVVRHHPERSARVARGIRVIGGNGGYEVDAVGRACSRGGGAHQSFVGAEGSRERALVAEVPGEATGVDPGDARHVVFDEQVVERALGAPVARATGEIAHHHTGTERSPALVVGGVHAVVADVRVGERDHLPGVRRVGDDLLIARQRRVEHELAGGDGRIGTDCLALEARAVGEHEHGVAHRTLPRFMGVRAPLSE